MVDTDKMIYEEDDDSLLASAKIKVFGVGGGGSNAVNRMLVKKSEKVEYWVMNTDCQALAQSRCLNKLVLGRSLTKGLGAGGNPERGKEAAVASLSAIKNIVSGADMIFIACGEGGGTGTGAAPIIAQVSKESGALVVGVVTRPFSFEGARRRDNANRGIAELKKQVDSLIVVSNDKLVFNNGKLPITEAFSESDKILVDSVKTVSDLILVQGLINLDFADVKSTLENKGLALIGFGFGSGEKKGIQAAQDALKSPLLEASITGSKSMIINAVVSKDTSLDDVRFAIDYITEKATGHKNGCPDVSIIFGVQVDNTFKDKMKICIIATEFQRCGISDEFILNENNNDRRISETEKEIERMKKLSVEPDYLKGGK